MAGLRRIAGAALSGLGEGIIQQAANRREDTLMMLRREWQVEDRDLRREWQVEDRDLRREWQLEDRAADPPASYETVRDPFGFGDIYQRDTTTGQMSLLRGRAAGRDKAPAGYRWTEGGDLEPIPGGPADTKAEKLDEKARGREESARQQANLALTHIGEIRGMVNESPWTTTGAVGSWLSKIGGTEAHDLDRRVDSLKAMIGFNALNQMRANSPTGGALGNVTERELALLQSTVASLEQSQSKDQFLQNLRLVEDQFLRTVHGEPDTAPAARPGTGQPSRTGTSKAGMGAQPDYSNMTTQQVRDLVAQIARNPENYTQEEIDAAADAWDRLMGGALH